MASLNQYGEEIIESVGLPFDIPLFTRAKDLFKQARAERIRQSIERNGVDEIFVQKYIAKLIKVDNIDDCQVQSGCLIMRTENKIPKPIRYKSDSPFIFVGSPTANKEYLHVKGFTSKFVQHTRFVYKKITYEYIDEYLYLRGNKLIKRVRIDSPYESPELVMPDCNGGICYTDDMEFPISADMANSIIKEIISTGILLANKIIVSSDVPILPQ